MATDKHEMGYEETVAFIKGLPMTWIPALLLELVRTGYAKKCFRPFGASTLVNNLENKDDMRIIMQGETDAPGNRRDQGLRETDRG